MIRWGCVCGDGGRSLWSLRRATGAGWRERSAPGGMRCKPGALLRQSGRCWAAGMPGCRGSWHTGLGDPITEKHAPKRSPTWVPGEFLRNANEDGNRFRQDVTGSFKDSTGPLTGPQHAIAAVPSRLAAEPTYLCGGGVRIVSRYATGHHSRTDIRRSLWLSMRDGETGGGRQSGHSKRVMLQL